VAICVMGQAYSKKLIVMLYLLALVSLKFFISHSLLFLFFTFEISLVPIFMIIMGWGYQAERVTAGKALFLYTAIGSIPLLIIILIFFKRGKKGLYEGRGVPGEELSICLKNRFSGVYNQVAHDGSAHVTTQSSCRGPCGRIHIFGGNLIEVRRVGFSSV